MSLDETRAVLNQMHGQHLLMAELLHGAGLRLMECVRLRVNSIDIERSHIYVRFGKGGIDRDLPHQNRSLKRLERNWRTETHACGRPGRRLWLGLAAGRVCQKDRTCGLRSGLAISIAC